MGVLNFHLRDIEAGEFFEKYQRRNNCIVRWGIFRDIEPVVRSHPEIGNTLQDEIYSTTMDIVIQLRDKFQRLSPNVSSCPGGVVS